MIFDYVKQFDIALQPDVTDYASPLKMFEYMAAKSLVIAPSKPNIREILDDDCAVLFDPNSKNAFKNSLTVALESIEQKNDMRERVYEKMWDKGFTWDENARRIAKKAESLLAELRPALLSRQR